MENLGMFITVILPCILFVGYIGILMMFENNKDKK